MRCCRPPAHRQIRAPSAAGECVSRGRVPSWRVDRTKAPSSCSRRLAVAQAVAGVRGPHPAWNVDRTRSASAAAPTHRRGGGAPCCHGLRGGDPIRHGVLARTAYRRAEGHGCRRRLLRPRGQRTRVAGAGAGLRVPAPVLGTRIRHSGIVAVLRWATTAGHRRLWATVWEWNTASRRVLAKVGFAGDRAAGTPPRDQLRHHEAAELLLASDPTGREGQDLVYWRAMAMRRRSRGR